MRRVRSPRGYRHLQSYQAANVRDYAMGTVFAPLVLDETTVLIIPKVMYEPVQGREDIVLLGDVRDKVTIGTSKKARREIRREDLTNQWLRAITVYDPRKGVWLDSLQRTSPRRRWWRGGGPRLPTLSSLVRNLKPVHT